MRVGGLGQVWSTLMRLCWIMIMCQLLSPLVALLAVVVSGAGSVSDINTSDTLATTIANSDTSTTTLTTPSTVSTTDLSSTSPEPSIASECCRGNSSVAACPSDHVTRPELCQDPSVPCSSLPLSCLSCSCHYDCVYGSESQAQCSVVSGVQCQGEREVRRQFTCSYCFLTHQHKHTCSNRDIGQ